MSDHRYPDERERCANCFFFRDVVCAHDPPRIVEGHGDVGQWPVVGEDGWCGRHVWNAAHLDYKRKVG